MGLKNTIRNSYVKAKKTIRKKGFRMGTYTFGTAAVVLAILVIINMCVSARMSLVISDACKDSRNS